MKKLISLSLALVMVLCLAACGAQNNNGTQNNSGEQNNAAADSVGNTVTGDQDQSVEQPDDEQVSDETPSVDGGESTVEPEEQPEEEIEEETEEETDDEQSEEIAVITASHSDVTFKAAGNSFKLLPKGVEGEYAVTYLSADAAVAAVAGDGTVTAVAPGTTTVTMQVKKDGVLYDFSCIIRCSWTDAPAVEEETDKPAQSVDLVAFFMGYMEGLGDNAPFMMAAEGEILDAFYPGLSSYSFKQSVIQMAAMSAVPFEFALIELENTGDMDAVKAILQARVDAQASGGAWYPETIAAWEKAEVVVNGNYVAMIVAGDQQADAVASFQALFN